MLNAEAEVEDDSSRPSLRTKFWPRGQLVIEDLTSLTGINYCVLYCSWHELHCLRYGTMSWRKGTMY